MAGKDYSDEMLVSELTAGNRHAFELLYERYFDRLLSFALNYTGDVQKAEDCVQEAFIRLMKHRDKFDQNRRFSTWMFTITANICKNHIRDEQKRTVSLQPEQAASEIYKSPEETIFDYKILMNEIRIAKESFSEKEKNIFTLRFDHDMSLKDIAVLLQMPEGSVRSCLFYMLKKLSKQLKPYRDGTV